MPLEACTRCLRSTGSIHGFLKNCKLSDYSDLDIIHVIEMSFTNVYLNLEISYMSILDFTYIFNYSK